MPSPTAPTHLTTASPPKQCEGHQNPASTRKPWKGRRRRWVGTPRPRKSRRWVGARVSADRRVFVSLWLGVQQVDSGANRGCSNRSGQTPGRLPRASLLGGLLVGGLPDGVGAGVHAGRCSSTQHPASYQAPEELWWPLASHLIIWERQSEGRAEKQDVRRVLHR